MKAALQFERLSCGIPVCFQTSSESKLLNMSVWINAGSARDPEGKGGLAHLCEHLLLRPLVATDSRANRLQVKSGALVNACTDPEWVAISAQAPISQFENLIDLLTSLVCEPYCKSAGLDMEREVILREMGEEEPGPSEVLSRIFHESAFSGNLNTQPIGGTSATLGALELSDVQEYYDRFLNGAEMMITAHGGRAWELTERLEEAFQDFPATPVSNVPSENQFTGSAQFPPDYRPVRIFRDMPNEGSASSYGVLAGFGAVPRRTEDYWTALAFEVLMADGPGSLLNQWLRNEHHWIYGIASMTEAFSNWGSQYFLMRVSHDQADEMVEHLALRWQKLPENVTDEQVEALRNRLASRALSSMARMQDRMTLMRDIALTETRRLEALEGGLEAFIACHARDLNSSNLLSYIRQYALWGRVSIVCAPI